MNMRPMIRELKANDATPYAADGSALSGPVWALRVSADGPLDEPRSATPRQCCSGGAGDRRHPGAAPTGHDALEHPHFGVAGRPEPRERRAHPAGVWPRRHRSETFKLSTARCLSARHTISWGSASPEATSPPPAAAEVHPFAGNPQAIALEPLEQGGDQGVLGLEMKEDEAGAEVRFARDITNPDASEALAKGHAEGRIQDLLSTCDLWCFLPWHQEYYAPTCGHTAMRFGSVLSWSSPWCGSVYDGPGHEEVTGGLA